MEERRAAYTHTHILLCAVVLTGGGSDEEFCAVIMSLCLYSCFYLPCSPVLPAAIVFPLMEGREEYLPFYILSHLEGRSLFYTTMPTFGRKEGKEG